MSETNTCSGPQCDRDVRAKGLCNGHYEQKRKGRTLTALRPRREQNMSAEGVGRWISQQVEIAPDSGCWIWPLTLRRGYGE